MSDGLGIWKVMTTDDFKTAEATGFIPDQPADRGSNYIHACSFHLIEKIREKFYPGSQTTVVRIDCQQAIAAGFRMVYEPSNSGIFYWHFYRPAGNTTNLLPYTSDEKSLLSTSVKSSIKPTKSPQDS